MEIIEKQVEKVKEVPTDGCYGYGYGRRDVNGKANAGLTLGIIGTALGAWALFGNRRSSGLLGLAVDTYTKIQDMVQAEILNLVKGRIEATPEGKELLQRQLKIVKKLKGKIIQETNREMEMFRKFREFSKTHPEVTYEEFIKASM